MVSFLTEQTNYLRLLLEEENIQSNQFCLQQRNNIQFINLLHFSRVFFFLFLFIAMFHGHGQVIILVLFNLPFYTYVSNDLYAIPKNLVMHSKFIEK